jgi:hypothetical protein
MKFHEISWHEISVQDFVPSILGTRASQAGIKDLGIVESQARLCILGHDMSILGRT